MRAAVSKLEVVWAFVIEGLEIPVFADDEQPRHLVLTGPNGSGKSSILRGLSEALLRWPRVVEARAVREGIANADAALGRTGLSDEQRSEYLKLRDDLQAQHDALWKAPIVNPRVRGVIDSKTMLHAYFPASRRFDPQAVSGPKRFAWPSVREPGNSFYRLFLQHLVNRRSEQAFAREGGDERAADQVKRWFEELELSLRELLDSPTFELRFDAKTFEFYALVDKQKLGFDTLPDGFASALTIWSDILLRTQSIAGEASGFVLIDEPELHLHPELQELLLPFLTRQFPGLQFIVATHSPIIATSLTRSTIYDLEQRVAKHGEDMQGFRYGNVLKSHFGLRTDFDAATTAKLDHLAELRENPARSLEQQAAYHKLARELAEHGHLLALEVIKEFDDD